MDLNFTFSPSPQKRHRQLTGSSDASSRSPLKLTQAERVKNTARDLLSGALAEAIKKGDDEPESGCEEAADTASSAGGSPVKRLLGSPFSSPTKVVRKRKRKSLDNSNAFHHTFVMKLFDRSVDLAQFHDQSEETGSNSNYPLYPVCRAWMRNEPANTNQAPRDRTPTPEPGSDSEEETDTSGERPVYHLPPPTPLTSSEGPSPRLPPPPPPCQTAASLDLDLDMSDSAPPPALLLSNHLVRWWGVRKQWKQAATENEERYSKSLGLLKEMFDK